MTYDTTNSPFLLAIFYTFRAGVYFFVSVVVVSLILYFFYRVIYGVHLTEKTQNVLIAMAALLVIFLTISFHN